MHNLLASRLASQFKVRKRSKARYTELVGTSARGYSGNAIPIMVSPDNGNATCNGISPVANYHVTLLNLKCIAGKATQLTSPSRDETQGSDTEGEFYIINYFTASVCYFRFKYFLLIQNN